MKSWLGLFSVGILSIVIGACGGPRETSIYHSSAPQAETGITGGDAVRADSRLSTYALLLRGTRPFDKGFICSGVFVAPGIILTAAHCLHDKSYKIEVIYSNDNNDVNASSSEIEQQMAHPEYDANQRFPVGDLALLKIKGPMPPDYLPLKLSTLAKTDKSFYALAMGYGIFSEAGKKGVGVLNRIMISVQSYDPQAQSFDANVDLKTGICPGDSGGPLFDLQNDDFVVIGITSYIFSYKSEEGKDYPCYAHVTYSNVNHYLSWIKAGIEKLNAESK